MELKFESEIESPSRKWLNPQSHINDHRLMCIGPPIVSDHFDIILLRAQHDSVVLSSSKTQNSTVLSSES